MVSVTLSQDILLPHLLTGGREMQHLDEILLVSDIPGSSVARPAPVTLPGLEMFPLLLVINLLSQLTQVLLFSHLTCQLLPVELLALYISPGLRPATQREIIPSTLPPSWSHPAACMVASWVTSVVPRLWFIM